MPKRSSCRKVVTMSHSRSQMEQQNCCLEESRFSEDPPQSRITLHEAKSDTCGPGIEIDKNSNDYQTRSCMARSLDENW